MSEDSERSVEEISERGKPTETVEKTANESKDLGPEKTVTIKKSTYQNMIKGLVIAIGVAAFFGGISVGTFDQGDNISKDDLEAMINDIVTNNPQAQEGPEIIQVSLDDDPVKGDPNAPVTVVEFSDFQCPFCSRFFDQTLPLIEKNYIDTGKIKLVYKDMPLDNLHPNARPAHIAAECADEQGKFWEYHDILFSRVGQWQGMQMSSLGNTFVAYADELQLDQESYIACLQSQSIAEEVHNDYLDGGRYGVTGTPSFFIGTEKDGFIKISGAQPYAVFEQSIESLLR